MRAEWTSFAGSQRGQSLALWIVAALVLFGGLGVPSLRGSEDRFAEITREMLLTGDFLHPRLNGESHFHKPLLSYWAIALASWLVGTLNELAARLPSAVAAFVALLATVRLGAELWGPAAGRVAGWVLLTSYGFLFWGRTAAADMENLAAVILAVAWFRMREDRPMASLYIVFGLICAVGAQAKGLAAIIVPIVVLMPHLLRFRRWRDHVRPMWLLMALVASASVYLAPFVWAEITRDGGSGVEAIRAGDPESGLYMVFQENVRRFYAPHDHRGSVFTYVAALPVLLLPWSLVFVGALVDCARDRLRLDPETRWVLWAIALVFALFTLSGSRRSYYILPILPFCALLIGAVLVSETRASVAAIALRWTIYALLAAVGLEAIVALLGTPLAWAFELDTPAGLILVTMGLAVAAYFGHRRGVRRGVAAPYLAIGLSAFLIGGYFVLQYPRLDRFRTEKPFALELRAVADRTGDRVAFVRHVPSLFPFYMQAETPIPVLRDAGSVRAFLSAGQGWVVASPRTLRAIPDVEWFTRPADLREALYPWDPPDERLGAWRLGVLPNDTGD